MVNEALSNRPALSKLRFEKSQHILVKSGVKFDTVESTRVDAYARNTDSLLWRAGCEEYEMSGA